MIFGSDDRELIDYTKVDGRFVQITSTFSNGATFLGSGVLIGANDVLTAAHTFYDHNNGGLAQSVVVTPSRFNDYKPFGSVNAEHFYLTEEWSVDKSFQYDYGLISLSTPIGYQTGWVDYGYISDLSTTAGTLMTSYGYAGDINSGNWLIKTSGAPDAVNGNILLFQDDLDASGGQSGSAVLTSSAAQSDVVIGLVSHQNNFPDQNGIVALNETSMTNIDTWSAANDDNLAAPKTTSYSFKDVEDISLLYINLLNRVPDEDGLNYWMGELDNDMQFNDIINAFLNSQELNSGLDYTGDNQSFVNSLYANILNREADVAGLEFWVAQLDTLSSKEDIISSFMYSQEYQTTQKQEESLKTYTLWHNWFESFSREISGTDSSEILRTTDGSDYIDAGAGNDVVNGLGGDDYLYGNIGNDTLTGGEGSDFFVFDLTQQGVDTVTDFDLANDKINLLSSYETLQVANIEFEETLVLYEDSDSYIILTGLVRGDFSEITFV